MLGLFHHKYIVNLLIIYYFFDSYVSLLLTIIKQMDCYASLNHNIYAPIMFTQETMTTYLLLKSYNPSQ